MPSIAQILIVVTAPGVVHLAAIRAGPWHPVEKRGLKTSLGRFANRHLWSLMLLNGLLLAAVWAGAETAGFVGAAVPFALLALPASLQAMVAWESYKQYYLGG